MLKLAITWYFSFSFFRIIYNSEKTKKRKIQIHLMGIWIVVCIVKGNHSLSKEWLQQLIGVADFGVK